MHKVLIITYYWPPSGGSSVLRWLKFAKYMREFEWEPIIYTPENPESQETDHSLLKDVPDGIEIIKTKIREPYNIYKWLTGRKKSDQLGVALMDEKKGSRFINHVSLWIRSNFFIPDPRIFWVKTSIRFLIQYLSTRPVDMIVTTGPPHSMHLIGLGIKKRTGIKWVADFRDPWTNIDFYDKLMLTKRADRKHKRLEKQVLSSADHVITVSPTMTEEFQTFGFQNVSTITNGFDVLTETLQHEYEPKFSLIHLGSMPPSRNPENLWKVFSEITSKNQRFAESLEIILAGKTDYKVKETIRKHNLEKYVRFQPHIPYNEAMALIQRSQVLLLFINNSDNAKSILTNKFFEYLSVQRPILAIGPPDGDAAKILSETNAGKIFDFQELETLKQYVLSLFYLYSQNKLHILGKGIEKYHRKNLTYNLIQLLNKIIS